MVGGLVSFVFVIFVSILRGKRISHIIVTRVYRFLIAVCYNISPEIMKSVRKHQLAEQH